jgi:hypothetical protein
MPNFSTEDIKVDSSSLHLPHDSSCNKTITRITIININEFKEQGWQLVNVLLDKPLFCWKI